MQAQVYETDLDYGQQHLEGYICNQKKKKSFFTSTVMISSWGKFCS